MRFNLRGAQREICSANTNIKKEEKSQINNVIFHVKIVGKEEL